jgi:hypothetical protein
MEYTRQNNVEWLSMMNGVYHSTDGDVHGPLYRIEPTGKEEVSLTIYGQYHSKSNSIFDLFDRANEHARMVKR